MCFDDMSSFCVCQLVYTYRVMHVCCIVGNACSLTISMCVFVFFFTAFSCRFHVCMRFLTVCLHVWSP